MKDPRINQRKIHADLEEIKRLTSIITDATIKDPDFQECLNLALVRVAKLKKVFENACISIEIEI